jgi:hypothetical protein
VNVPGERMPEEGPETTNQSVQSSCTTPQSTASPTQPMTPATRCEEIVEFTDQSGTRRRIRFVPQSGTDDQWQRIEEVWRNRAWQLVGQDTVSDVDHWTRPVQSP